MRRITSDELAEMMKVETICKFVSFKIDSIGERIHYEYKTPSRASLIIVRDLSSRLVGIKVIRTINGETIVY